MFTKKIATLSLSIALLAGCDTINGWMGKGKTNPSSKPAMASDEREAGKAMVAPALKKVAVAKVGPSKNATTQPSDNNVTGTVTFTEMDGHVMVVADLSGLKPGSTHGFHIHDKGDLTSADLSSAGGHFDPGATKTHGDPDHADHAIHAGDLGNLVADDKGNVHAERTVMNISIDGPNNGIVGRSVIIHAKADDLKTNPAGNSGARVAGGVIEKTSQQ